MLGTLQIYLNNYLVDTETNYNLVYTHIIIW